MNTEERKHIEVVAAVICDGNRIFATQRGYGEWKDWWEFPGGKMEPGETPEAALQREIREELATEISVESLLLTLITLATTITTCISGNWISLYRVFSSTNSFILTCKGVGGFRHWRIQMPYYLHWL